MSVWDAFWFNNVVAVGGCGFTAAYYLFAVGPTVFPGGDYLLACVGYLLIMIPETLMYSFVAAMMPRSGGDYIFDSRAIHPFLGFFANLNFVFWAFGWVAYDNFLLAVYWGRLMYDFGLPAAAAWSIAPDGVFVLSTIATILVGLLVLWGFRRYFIVQNTVVVWSAVAIVACMIVLVVNASTLHQTFNKWAITNNLVSGPDPYQTVISNAAAAGYSNPGFSAFGTMGLAFVMWSMANGFFSVYVAGEMKSASSFKTQVISLLGCAVLAIIFIGSLYGVMLYALGNTFLGSFMWLAPTFGGVATSWDFFVRIQTPLAFMIPAVDVILVVASIVTSAIILYGLTRCIFAWSFDRVVPTKLASVSERFHSPVNAVILASAGVELLCFLLLFTGFVAVYTATTFGVVLTILITSVAVAIFPYRRKRIFEASAVKYRIAGIPAMTIVGVFSALVMLLASYVYIIVPALYGISLVTVYVIVALFIAAAIIYYGSKMYHQKAEGIDISLAFKDIPPE
jgi:amino acid transporter